MSTFESELGSLETANFELFGDTGLLYTPGTGDAVSLTYAVWGGEQAGERDQDDGRGVVTTATMLILASDVADPQVRGTITRESLIWTIVGRSDGQAGTWLLDLEKYDRADVSGPDYRMQRT